MKMNVKRRHQGPPIIPLSTDVRNSTASIKDNKKVVASSMSKVVDKGIRILYGSDAGSCEALAKELEQEAQAMGFSPTIKSLDESIELPKDHPVIIIAASYDGKPTANARKFTQNLASSPGPNYKDCQIAIFGVGHSDWVETYQRIPKTFETAFSKLGAKSIIARGEGNAAGDLHGQWEEWKDFLFTTLVDGPAAESSSTEKLVSGLNRHKSGFERVRTGNSISRTLSGSSAKHTIVKVVENRVLVAAFDSGCEKRHLEVQATEPDLYEVGDYLCVVPKNSDAVVDRILEHFNIERTLKIDEKESAYDVLRSLEVSAPISRRTLGALSTAATDKVDKAFILDLDGDDDVYLTKVLDERLSLIDVLERCSSCKITFEQYINALHTIRSRQYSISSTPLDKDSNMAICFDVLRRKDQSTLLTTGGVATTYLARKEVDQDFQVTIRKSAFHLPRKSSVPIVCFAAGTGIAPFRGFIHQRALQIRNGEKVGTCVLYYGCRNKDDLSYRDELESWARDSGGKIVIKTSFSRSPEETDNFKYVHERALNDRQDILRAFKQGAAFYTCGSASKLARSLKLSFQQMVDEAKGTEQKKDYQDFFDCLSTSRYKVDIFG